jgi:hypothetical protein
MSDKLAEEPQEPAQRKKKEYENVKRIIKEQVDERNNASGDSPKFVFQGSNTVHLGNLALYLEFDQQFDSPADYVLVLKVGSARFKQPTLFGSAPTPVKHILKPAISEDPSAVVWKHKIGNLQPFTSSELVDFGLGLLISQYEKYKQN